jgi:CheY-like chemotaxis protein
VQNLVLQLLAETAHTSEGLKVPLIVFLGLAVALLVVVLALLHRVTSESEAERSTGVAPAQPARTEAPTRPITRTDFGPSSTAEATPAKRAEPVAEAAEKVEESIATAAVDKPPEGAAAPASQQAPQEVAEKAEPAGALADLPGLDAAKAAMEAVAAPKVQPEPAEAEAKPAEPTVKPAEAEAKPAEPVTKPALPAVKPAQPVEPEAKPSKPAEAEAKPAKPEAKPVEAEAKPAKPEAKPAKPVEAEAKPAKPVEAKAKPAKPVEAEAKPAKPEAKPVAPVAKPAEAAAKPAGPAAEAGAAKSARVLLVEDSKTMRKIVDMILAGEPYDLTTLEKGSEALSRAKELRPDVIIADLSLDDKNGYEICRDVRADDDLGQTPVILLHGSSSPIDQSKADEVGASDNLSKPFPSNDLLDKLKALAQ